MKHYYDRTIFGNYPKTVESLIKLLGRKWKSNIEDISRLCDVYRYYPKKVIRSVPISCRSLKLSEIFGNHIKASRIIRQCLNIGLLAITSNDIKFNHGDDNRSMTYVINREVMDLVNIANVKHNGGKRETKGEINIIEEDKEMKLKKNNIDPNVLAKVIISSKKRPNLTNYNDEELREAIYIKYPQIKEYQNIIRYLNKNMDWQNSPFEIRFEPNIGHKYTTTGNKNYTRFSIRYSSEFMNWSKDTRSDWVQSYFDRHVNEDAEWFEYDVNASIFRVTYLLNNGYWLNYSGDLYEYWYGRKFESTEARKQFKQLCSIIYFSNSDAKAYQSYSNHYNVNSSMKEWYIERFSELRHKMEQTIGRFYDSEIFMHESCIYIGMLKVLADEFNIRALPVYDCIYSEISKDRTLEETKLVIMGAIQIASCDYYRNYNTDLFEHYGLAEIEWSQS